MAKRSWAKRCDPRTPGAICWWPVGGLPDDRVILLDAAAMRREAEIVTLLAMRREGLAPPAPVLENDAIPF